MNAKEVNKFIDANTDVVGQTCYGERKVTHLFAAPSDEKDLSFIIDNVLSGRDYSSLTDSHSDFTAYVLIDGNYDDVIPYETLENYLRKKGG